MIPHCSGFRDWSLSLPAETVILLITHVFQLHGIPTEIISDRGPQFTSTVWKHFCSSLSAKSCLSSGFHNQTNGQCERLNQEIENTLWCLCSQKHLSWSVHLPWVEYSHNSHVCSATGLYPFEVSLGYQPPLLSVSFPDPVGPLVRAHIRAIRLICKQSHSALQKTSAQNKLMADKKRRPAPTYSPGQLVWLSKYFPLKSLPRKLAPPPTRFLDPLPIKKSVKQKIPSHHRVQPNLPRLPS